MTADGLKSNCPATGIHYIPKTPREPSRTTGHPSRPTSTGIPFQGRGNLIVSSMGGKRGCIISRGKWFASGTCATFKAKKVTGRLLTSRPLVLVCCKNSQLTRASDDTFTLQSSKGICAFEGDALSCGAHVTAPQEFSVSPFPFCLDWPASADEITTGVTGPGWHALLSRKYYIFRRQGTKRPHAEHRLLFSGRASDRPLYYMEGSSVTR
jgi:hypothetical protein